MDKRDELLGLMRDLGAQLMRQNASMQQQAMHTAGVLSMQLCAIKALIRAHPEPGRLRERWNAEVSGYWAGLASADPLQKVNRDAAESIQAQIESALGPR